MSSEGELFCREHVPDVLDDVERVVDVPVEYWTNTQKRLPDELELEAEVNGARESIVVTLESTIRTTMMGDEYVGKEVVGYEMA